MKKILTGIFLIALTVGLVSGAAYAVFSDTVTMNNLAITAGNAALEISKGSGYSDSVTLDPLSTAAYPGYENTSQFIWVRNNSASNIQLSLRGYINTVTSSDWNSFKDKMLVGITDEAGTHVYVPYTPVSSWYDAKTGTPKGLGLNINLNKGEWLKLRLWVKIDSSATNTIANDSISTNWIIDATQVL